MAPYQRRRLQCFIQCQQDRCRFFLITLLLMIGNLRHSNALNSSKVLFLRDGDAVNQYRKLAAPVTTPTTPSPYPSTSEYPTGSYSPSPVPSRLLALGRPTAKAPSSPTTTPSPCFSAVSVVEVKDVGLIEMNRLNIGDYVKASNGQYTQVYGFGHKDHDWEEEFRQVIFEDDDPPLELTSQHLVFVTRDHVEYTIPASAIIAGDTLSGKTVQSLRNVTRRGVYSPLTHSGDIMASGIRASVYVNVVVDDRLLWDQHKLGHSIFAPQRLFCSYFIETCQKEIYIDGYGLLAYIVVRIGSFANDQGFLGALTLSLLLAPIVGIASAVEALTGFGIRSGAVIFLMLITMISMIHKRLRTK